MWLSQKELVNLNLYVSNIIAFKYTKQNLTKREIDKYTLIIRDFNTSLSITEQADKKNH